MTPETATFPPPGTPIRRSREINERLAPLNEAFEFVTDDVVVFCECRDFCPTQLHVKSSVWDSARTWPGCFLVAPGHASPTDEVVAHGAGFEVVRSPAEPEAADLEAA